MYNLFCPLIQPISLPQEDVCLRLWRRYFCHLPDTIQEYQWCIRLKQWSEVVWLADDLCKHDMISPERYILNFFNVMYVPSSNRTALSLLPDARSWFSIISSLEIFSKPRYFGTKLVTKASLTILIIRLKYRSLFTMNIVLEMLVDSPILS